MIETWPGLVVTKCKCQYDQCPAASSVKQCWFADDGSGAGSTTESKKWWDVLSTLGLLAQFGLIFFQTRKNAGFSQSQLRKKVSINVTVQGQKHLGVVIGSRDYLEEYDQRKGLQLG